MTAIAYITDTNMLEFHRLRGSESMVFWRFSLRKFTRFHRGDLVFFIDSQSRHPETGEKGLIGYGRCTEIRNKTPKATFDAHETKTGYASYEDFTEAIKHFRKNDHRLPQTLQVIKLERVHFFQSPVFLSEVDIQMSSRLESFLYIEKDGVDKSIELLEIADKLGLDQWMLSQNKNITLDSLKDDMKHQKLREILKEVEITYTEKQIRMIKNHTNCVVQYQTCYEYQDGHLTIYYPIVRKSQINAMLGVKMIYDKLLDENYTFQMIYDYKLDAKTHHLLELLNIKHARI